MTEFFQTYERLWLTLVGVTAFFVSYYAPVIYTYYDPGGSLLVSQAIVQHGTVKLDAYPEAHTRYQFYRRDDSYYYRFPLGTSIFVTPFVWLANLFGKDMTQFNDDGRLQLILSAATITLSYMLVYAMCRAYVDAALSLLLSSVFVFGSSITSTMATALWSTNLTVVFILISLTLLIYDDQGKIQINPYLLGCLLFAAYLCRPTASIFALVAFVYIFWKKRPLFIKVVATYTVLFGIFILVSLVEYHRVLPDYYQSSRLDISGPLVIALYGNLLSPARGILVYSPYLILTVAGVLYFRRQLFRQPFF